MNTWKIILATLTIFGAGVVTGGLLQEHAHDMPVLNFLHSPPPPKPTPPLSPRGLRFEFLRRVQRELDLTTVQRQRIDELLARSQERTRQLMEPIIPQLHAEVRKAKEDFCSVLTTEQRQRFEELVQAHRARGQFREQRHEHPVDQPHR